MTEKVTGSCFCGAVQFEIELPTLFCAHCHCSMCRKWSGGVYLSVEVRPDEITIEGAENLGCYPSSEWAQRAFCKTCGSSLWYEVTAPGPLQNVKFLALGTLSDPSGTTLNEELFIDHKPNGYSFAENTRQVTKAEFEAMFAEG